MLCLLADVQTTCSRSFSFCFLQLVQHPVSFLSCLSMSSPLETKYWTLKRCSPPQKISFWREPLLELRTGESLFSGRNSQTFLLPYLCSVFPVFFWNIFWLASMAAIIHLFASKMLLRIVNFKWFVDAFLFLANKEYAFHRHLTNCNI